MSILLYCKRCKVKFWDSAPLEKSTLMCTACDEIAAKEKSEAGNIQVLSAEVTPIEEEELPL